MTKRSTQSEATARSVGDALDRIDDVAWTLAWHVLGSEAAAMEAIEAAFTSHAASGAPWGDDAALLARVHREACSRVPACCVEGGVLTLAEREVMDLVFVARLGLDRIAAATRRATSEVRATFDGAMAALANAAQAPAR